MCGRLSWDKSVVIFPGIDAYLRPLPRSKLAVYSTAAKFTVAF